MSELKVTVNEDRACPQGQPAHSASPLLPSRDGSSLLSDLTGFLEARNWDRYVRTYNFSNAEDEQKM